MGEDAPIPCIMTPQDMIAFRARMGWSRDELARRLDISSSRLIDYEVGQTRTKPPRPAPIPRTVELAVRWLEEHTRPLSPEEKPVLWSDDRNWPQYSGPPIDDSREAIYDEPRGL
jgi:hypothetical protein